MEAEWRTPRDQWQDEGISRRTFFRKLKAGIYETKYVSSPKGGGKGGQQLLVRLKTQSQKTEILSQAQASGSENLMARRDDKKRYLVHSGEPGCHEVMLLRVQNGDFVKQDVNSLASVGDPSRRGLAEDGDHNKAGSEGAPVIKAPVSGIPSVPALLGLPDSGVKLPASVNPKLLREGNLKFVIVCAYRKKLSENHKPKGQATQEFVELFNSGFLLPDIHNEIGSICKNTLGNWDSLENQGGVDGLIPRYRGPQGSDIALAEKQFLRTKLLDQNRPTIGDSINKCKFLLGEASPSSPYKLRRWVKEFRRNNYDLWTLEREGQKALNDKCVPYAEREWRDLAVGEAVVADGHKLNFQVINPFTGKPCRAIMVLFWDWKSSYPLGWEIMLTESIQCVVAALRNSIITLGKFPKNALLDNGKAFRANIFRKKFSFQETEIPGIFDKLSIIPHFAMPYNAQSKPIERFFRTFNNWFERELPSYSGASIPDKPAHMNRNEKRAKDLHNEWVPTIPEAMELIFRWREYYIDQPSRARDGQRPRDIFDAEKGPGVDPFALHFLMMTCKARMVHRNGITFNGWHWYHESLYGIKDKVVMFYSYYDLSQVYIFTVRNDGSPGEFLCVAKPVEKVKPFASDSEFPEDMAAVKRIVSTKRKLVQTTKKLADMLQSEKQVYVDWNRSLRDRPEVAEAIKKIENKNKPKKLISLSSEKEIEDFEIRPEEEGSIRFSSFSEKYEFLIRKPDLSEAEEKWIHQFKTGQIGSGEYETIYGGGQDALQIHRYEERQKICIGG